MRIQKFLNRIYTRFAKWIQNQMMGYYLELGISSLGDNENTLPTNLSPNISSRQVEVATFVIAEYESLREEVLKRLEFQNQTITLTLIVAGTFLTVATQSANGYLLLFIYPILACFLALGWFQNNLRIRLINIYIRNNIEPYIPGKGWECFRINITKNMKFSATAISAFGTIFGTQLMSVLVALPNFTNSPIEIGLIVIDGFSMIVTFVLLQRLPLM